MAMAKTEGVSGVPWSAAMPLLCVAHCLAAPLLLVIAPALAENKAVEAGLMGVSAVIALLVVGLGVRKHGEPQVWLPVVVGLGFWMSALLTPGEAAERLLTVAGGVFLVGGLFWDARLRHRTVCRSCREAR
jgi:hypothetical protein